MAAVLADQAELERALASGDLYRGRAWLRKVPQTVADLDRAIYDIEDRPSLGSRVAAEYQRHMSAHHKAGARWCLCLGVPWL